MVLRRLDADYKSFFALWKKGDQRARPPRFKGKQHFTTLHYNQSGFIIDTSNKTINFSHKHPSGIKLQFELPWLPPITGRVKQVEIFQDRQCRWFINLIIDENAPEYIDNGLYQAIDLGVLNIITGVNMHGKFIQIQNRRPDIYWQKKIQEVQSKRDHCKKYSKKWHRYTAKLQKMQSKLTNQLRDFQHKIAKCVVENTRANTIALGALNIKTMAQKKNPTNNPQQTKTKKTLNRSLQSTGFLGRFADFLTYKACKVGKRVVRIDEAYTTQTCCVCGNVQRRKLSERYVICDCGNPLDRDQNAAVNIMVRFLSQQPPVNGEPLQAFLNGLYRHTALPYLPWVVDSIKTSVAIRR